MRLVRRAKRGFGMRRLDAALCKMDWPHSPVHRLASAGAFMVTAGTYLKHPVFSTGERLAFLCRTLFAIAEKHECRLQAWAVFPNHYHIITSTPPDPGALRAMLSHLHTETASEMNRQDNTPKRKVWFQYWDSHLTFPRSYFTRLSYVHQNAVRPWNRARGLKLSVVLSRVASTKGGAGISEASDEHEVGSC